MHTNTLAAGNILLGSQGNELIHRFGSVAKPAASEMMIGIKESCACSVRNFRLLSLIISLPVGLRQFKYVCTMWSNVFRAPWHLESQHVLALWKPHQTYWCSGFYLRCKISKYLSGIQMSTWSYFSSIIHIYITLIVYISRKNASPWSKTYSQLFLKHAVVAYMCKQYWVRPGSGVKDKDRLRVRAKTREPVSSHRAACVLIITLLAPPESAEPLWSLFIGRKRSKHALLLITWSQDEGAYFPGRGVLHLGQAT